MYAATAACAVPVTLGVGMAEAEDDGVVGIDVDTGDVADELGDVIGGSDVGVWVRTPLLPPQPASTAARSVDSAASCL